MAPKHWLTDNLYELMDQEKIVSQKGLLRKDGKN